MSDVSLALSAGDEGSSRPVSSPCPPQLPPCAPLSDASVLAGRSRGPASLRLAAVLVGSAHQAPCLPQGGANSVRQQLLANACTKQSAVFVDTHALVFDISAPLQKLFSAAAQPHPHRLIVSGNSR